MLNKFIGENYIKLYYTMLAIAFIFGVMFFWRILDGLHLEKVMSYSDWFSAFGFLCQFLLVIVGAAAIRQIAVAKNDLRTRCLRESIKESSLIADDFALNIIPEINKLKIKTKGMGHSFLLADLNDFKEDEIEKTGEVIHAQYKNDMEFWAEHADLANEYVMVFNKFESVAIKFIKGIANEESVFLALSWVYCLFIKESASLLSFLRTKNGNNFTNTVELYKIWSGRIEEQKLILESEGIRDQIKHCSEKSKTIKPIGV